MKKALYLCVLVFTLFACNSEGKQANPTPVVEKEPVKELTVDVRFKSSEAGNFKLMLNKIKVDEFQSKFVHIVEEIKPTTNIDHIKANFGPNNISTRFQFGLGNKTPKTIEIESINFNYDNKTVAIDASKLKEHFLFNKFVEIDSVTHKIVTKKVEGKHFPVITLKNKYLKQLMNPTK